MPFCIKLFFSKIVKISFINCLTSAFQATKKYKLFRAIIANYKIKNKLVYKCKSKNKLEKKLRE